MAKGKKTKRLETPVSGHAVEQSVQATTNDRECGCGWSKKRDHLNAWVCTRNPHCLGVPPQPSSQTGNGLAIMTDRGWQPMQVYSVK